MDALAANRIETTPGILRLALTDFRCYRRLRLDLGPEPVVLTGPNGAGKTNILEALSLLAPGRGLRGAALAEPDRRADGQAAGPWTVAATIGTPTGPMQLGTGREGERRVVRIDGRPRAALKDLAEALSIVWLTPELDRLFLEAPKGRRRFLDRMVFGFDPEHAAALAAYEYCQRERQRLLAEGKRDDAWLAATEDGMARHGVALAAGRAAAVARLDRAARAGWPHFPRASLALAGEVDAWLGQMPALAVEDRLRERLADARAADAEAGKALVGPHRSDLIVRDAARGLLASEGSTGEQKALLISITLAFAAELAAARGNPPILLLDEIAAHLDRARRAALFEALGQMRAQAWLTGTDEEVFKGLSGRATFFAVFDATVTSR